MAKLFIKVKSVFSRRSRSEESSPSSDTSSSTSDQHSETEAPAYHHAAAAQPPAYQSSPSQPQPAVSRPSDAPPTTFHERAREIAKIQVGGMRRTVGGGGASSFTTSYAPVQPTGPPPGTWKNTTGHTTNSSYGQGSHYAPGSGEKSTFQGTPNGAVQGHQQELAEDDEDVWARMMM